MENTRWQLPAWKRLKGSGKMKRFVKIFFWKPFCMKAMELSINQCAEANDFTIISVTPITEGGVAVIFEAEGEQE
jgi:hypothetical protein